MPDLGAFQEMLGVRFDNTALLEQALVHSSYINENPSLISGHNERLEFLGDAVLGFIVADEINQQFPYINEGEMTKLRAALVRRDTLARIAGSINLGDFLYLGRGEDASGGRNRVPNLAGALEAVIAAVYLDRGISVTREMIVKLLDKEWDIITSHGIGTDYKSKLQEIVQSGYQVTPEYRLVAESGPDHNKVFTVEVMAAEKVLGAGIGTSKKLAETEAARLALERLKADFTD